MFHAVFMIVFSLRKGLYRSDEGKERRLFFNFCLFEVLHLPILLYRQQLWCHERFGSLRSDIVECNRVIGNAALKKMLKLENILDEKDILTLKENLSQLEDAITDHPFPGWKL